MALGEKYNKYEVSDIKYSKNKLYKYIVFLGIFSIIVLCSLFIYFKDTNNLLKRDSLVYINEITEQNAINIKKFVEDDMIMLEAVAMTLSEVEVSQYEDVLYDFNENPKFKSFNRFGIINKSGIGKNGLDLSDREYFKTAVSGKSNLSKLLFSRIENKWVQVYAIPILKKDNIIGVLTATIDVERFKNKIFTNVLDNDIECIIFTKKGDIVLSSNTSNLNYKPTNIYKENKFEMVDSELAFLKLEGEEKYINIHSVGINDWYLGTIIPYDLIEKKLKNTFRSNIYSSLLFIFILFSLILYILFIQLKSKQKLSELAYFDELTGFPNKNLFVSKAQSVIENSELKNAYVILDVKQFKLINDKYGYVKGNEVLKHISNTLKMEFESENEEIFSRFTADNFHILLNYIDIRDIELRIKKLSLNIRKTIFENNLLNTINFNCGIKLIENKETSIQSIGDKAMIALKRAKLNNEFINYYNEEMRFQILEEEEIENYSKTAFENEEFKLYVQPKYNIENSEIVGGEALVRWLHPQKGMIFPDKFIELFEKNGDIIKLDEYMLRKSCEWLKSRIENGLSYIPISVNQSRLNLYNKVHIEHFTDIVDSYEIPRNLIEIEITENMFLEDLDLVKVSLDSLHDYGFKVSMDDFGAGHSSLNMLQDINVDVIKLDRKFCNSNANEERGRKIIKNIVLMAKELNIEIIAEGVELKEQADFLKSIGCNKAQGYYYSKPIPVEDFEKLLEKNNF